MPFRSVRLVVGGTPRGEAVTWSYPNTDGNLYTIPTHDLRVEGTDAQARPLVRVFQVIRFGVHRKTSSAAASVVGLANRQTHTIKRWVGAYRVHSNASTEDGAWHVFGDYLIHDGPKLSALGSSGAMSITYLQAARPALRKARP